MIECVRVKIKTKRVEKLLNLLRKKAQIFDITKTHSSVAFSCLLADKEGVEEVLDLFGAKYEYCKIDEKKSSRLILATPFIIAIVSIIALLFIAEFFILDIEITADYSKLDKNSVEECLIENGIVIGKSRTKIDIQRLLGDLNAIENVAYATVRNEGVRFSIFLVNELLPHEIVEESNEPIFSKKDAVLTKITVDSGSTDFKVGDTVKKGDILIKNEREGNHEGEIIPCNAKGEVYGIVYYSKSEKIDTRGIDIYSQISRIKAELLGEIFLNSPSNTILESRFRVKRIDNISYIVIYYLIEEKIS